MRPVPSMGHLRSQSERLKGLREAAEHRLSQTQKDIRALQTEAELLDAVQAVLRTLIDKEVTAGVQAVETLLTEGLQTVFHDQKLSVESEVSLNRGKVSVDLTTVYERPDGTLIKGVPNDSFGGSVATVQSVLLRILVMRRRGLRPLLLLDETLPAFDSTYVGNMGEFLQLVCSRLGVDVLLVTHNPALVEAADKAYRIVRTQNGARFEVTRG